MRSNRLKKVGLRQVYGWGEKKVMNEEKSTEKGWDKKV